MYPHTTMTCYDSFQRPMTTTHYAGSVASITTLSPLPSFCRNRRARLLPHTNGKKRVAHVELIIKSKKPWWVSKGSKNGLGFQRYAFVAMPCHDAAS